MVKLSRPSPRTSIIALTVVVVTVITLGVVSAVITVDAPKSHASAGDGGVWVTNESKSAVGRFNTEINELNAVVTTPVVLPELIQSGKWVLTVDRSLGVVTRIDVSTARPAGSLTLPDGQASIVIVGDNALIVPRESGIVTAVPLATFGLVANNSPQSQNGSLNLGPGATVTTTPAGGFLGFSPSRGEIVRAEPGTALEQPHREPIRKEGNANQLRNANQLQLTATDRSWAVLDAHNGTLTTPNAVISLRSGSASLEGALLQNTASATAGRETIFVATHTALLEIDVASSKVSTVSSNHDGAPVRPVTVAGCTFAAWADGGFWSRCATPSQSAVSIQLLDLSASAGSVFRVNADRVVLNDPAAGRVWAVEGGGELSDGWAAFPALAAAPAAEKIEPVVADDLPPALPVKEASKPNAASVPVAQSAASPAMPKATAVTARLDGDNETVTLTWSPFGAGTGGDPILGYFAQNLGTDLSAPHTLCAAQPGSVQPPTGGVVQNRAVWTTATFENISDKTQTYSFVVWGYSRAGCVASETVMVAYAAAPNAITAVVGEMVEAGTEIEFQITALSPAADHYEVQRTAAELPVGPVATFDTVGVSPRTVTGGPFGENYAFQIRACNSPGEGSQCGPWSAHSAPEASLSFALTDLHYSPSTGQWMWSARADNGSLSVKVRCGSYSGAVVSYSGGDLECLGNVAVASDDAWLTVLFGTFSHRFNAA